MNQEVTTGWLGRQEVRRFKARRRSNSILIVVQEVYLRDDIPCGSSLCRSCVQQSPTLPADASHYLILDADSLTQFMEVWELPQITGVIYLSSVVKEAVNHMSQHNYRKLRSLFTDRRRQSTFFDDEHFIYTWSLNSDQTASGAQSRKRVEAVAGWFYEHLGGSAQIVALQPLDRGDSSADESVVSNQLGRLSIGDGCRTLQVLTVDTYIKEYWHHDTSVSELFSSLVQSRAEAVEARIVLKGAGQADVSARRGGKGSHGFKEHLSVDLIEAEVADGLLRVGVFHVDKNEPLEGFIYPSNKGEASKLAIFVPGRLLQNRALPGDLVAVRILESKLWQAPKKASQRGKKADSKMISEEESKLPYLIDEEDDSSDVAESNLKVPDSVQDRLVTEEAVPTGEVVGILQRVQRDYVACLAQEDEDYLSQSLSSRRENFLCVPMDRRIPMVRLNTRFTERLVGQRFVIRIDRWDQDSRVPSGHFVRLLGPIGDLDTEIMALMVENGISDTPFSTASLQELPEDTAENPWTIPEKELSCRRDFRLTHRTCSIDPPESKDVDDALSVRRLPNGFLEIGVHIADVSYFVRQGSLLDLEARARGTTVYMVGKSWHMLPSILSENLCSLKCGVDRLAVSVVWTVDPENDFEILDVWFGRSIVHSAHQLFYAQAQAIVDGEILPPGWEVSGGKEELTALESDLLILASFSQIRRDLRKANGAVELSSSELRFETAANKEPISVDAKQQLPMNWIVAELMILANSYVGTKIYRSFPSTALLRRHQPPRLDSFGLLLECCAARGFTLDTSSNKALADSLDRMRDSNDPVVENAFRALVTRAMSEAEYCIAGEQSDSSGVYHYGLALEFYTHFTSPIRRYADILVHRMLLAACQDNSVPTEATDKSSTVHLVPASQELHEVVEHLNERHRSSKRAQKECDEIYLLMFLQKHARAEHAVIIRILPKGVIVFVPKYDLRVRVYLEDKKGNIILPAEDDSDVDTGEILGQASDHVLVKEHGSLKINLSRSGETKYVYKLMDSVWVQLRADGSRAHAPKLRVRQLGPAHPAARASMLENARREHRGLAPPVYSLSRHNIPGKHKRGKGDKKQIVQDKKLSVEKIVKEFAVEQARSKEDGDLKGSDSLKRKEVASVYEVTEVFKRRKVASVYLDMECICSSGQQQDEVVGLVGSVDSVDVGLWMPLSIGMSVSERVLEPELWFLKRLRIVWQKKLDRAARIRATVIWSTLGNNSSELVQRAEKEEELRRGANVLSLWLQ
ncbi:hypothetical protein R1sor_007085 [Riccia sorocarpa]|uniref:DIS3-like exonuclease 1 n=1 Tax=Riccia sorocarpa TaxID=122646 RepID=A0ABD3HSW4_9MARC